MIRVARQIDFINSDATPKVTTVFVASESVASVMEWYGSYCADDRYQVLCDGLKLKKDQNGCLVGDLP